MTMTPTREFVSRPRESERTTRRPLGWWDRIKFLLLFAGLFAFFVAAEMSDNPLLPFREAFNMTLSSKWWIVALFGLEVLRQIHFLFCEHSARYYRFWQQHIFGRWNKHTGKFNSYTRYRVARALKIIVAILIVLLILARIFDTTIFRAPYDFLNWLIDNTPQMIQIVAFLVFWIGFQFGLIIFFATRGGVETFFPDDIETRFEDVWGQDQVRDKIKENLLLLEDPQVIEQHGGYVPAGLLLWGPPGTGKTLMAEAMAGESGKPFVNIDASMLNTMGMGVLKVKLLFRKLRKYALKYDGVVAFFDEADAIGSRGQLAGQQLPGMASTGSFFDHARTCGGLGYLSDASRACLLNASIADATDAGIEEGTRRNRFFMGMGGMGGGGGGVLQVLLTEMSGLKKPRGLVNRYARRVLGMKPKPPPKFRIVIVMATNLPEALDPAMLRPGRMGDRIYKVGYPSKAGRIRTYWGYFDKIPNSLTEDEVDRLATVTPYATGASIKGLVNEALINAIQDRRESVEWRDVVRAKQLKDLGPPEDVEYIERERHATALHEACHAVVAYRVRQHLVIDIATIEKGANYLGMVSSIPPEDLFTRWRSDYEADVMVSLASLVGEKLFFEGDSSSGVSNDLEQATQLAILMEGYWGMGSTIASHGITHRVGVAGGGRPGAGGGKPNENNKERELLKGGLAQRIEVKLSQLADRTEALLIENRVQILAVTHALESHKTLTGEDVEAIIEFKPGPLVDGRPYGTAEFAELAERYHEQVLAAHDAHGDVAVPLPPVPYVPSAPVASPVPVGVGGGPVGRVAPEHEADPWAPPVAPASPYGNGGGNGSKSDARTASPPIAPGESTAAHGNGPNGDAAAAVADAPIADATDSGNGTAAKLPKSAKDKTALKTKKPSADPAAAKGNGTANGNGKSGNGKKKGAPKSEPGEKWGWGSD